MCCAFSISTGTFPRNLLTSCKGASRVPAHGPAAGPVEPNAVCEDASCVAGTLSH